MPLGRCRVLGLVLAALLVLLFGRVESPFPQVAAVCAAIKFALLIAGMVYAFYGLASRAIPARA